MQGTQVRSDMMVLRNSTDDSSEVVFDNLKSI